MSLSDRSNWKKHQYIIITITCITLVILLIFLFSDIDSLITFKAVFSLLLLIMWLACSSYSISFFINRNNNFTKLKKEYKLEAEKPDEVYFTFDEEKIIDATKDFSLKLKWSYFGNDFLKETKTYTSFPVSAIQCRAIPQLKLALLTLLI